MLKDSICGEWEEEVLQRPPVKRLPEVTYVTIETPYGLLVVPKDTFECEGKEKIIAAHVEFMKQLEKLKKMGEQMGKSNKSSDYR